MVQILHDVNEPDDPAVALPVPEPPIRITMPGQFGGFLMGEVDTRPVCLGNQNENPGINP